MELSIIIANYNGCALLKQVLTTVYKNKGDLKFELWIVDNASQDDSLEMLAADFPDVKVIANQRNMGFAAANNQAIQNAEGEYLLLLNSDTLVHDTALQEMLEVMKRYPNLAALGPLLLNQNGSIQPSCLRFPNPLTAPFTSILARLRQNTKPSPSLKDELTVVDAVSGACLLLRKSALQEVGLLDEGYFFYAEETDWCYRAHMQGWRIGFTPRAQVTHLGGTTAKREANRFYIERRWSRVRFEWKHYGPSWAQADAMLIRLNLRLKASFGSRDQSDQLLAMFDERMKSLHTEAAMEGFPLSHYHVK